MKINSSAAYDRYIDGDSDKLDVAGRIAKEEKAPESYLSLCDAFEDHLVRLQTMSFREGFEYAVYLMQSGVI